LASFHWISLSKNVNGLRLVILKLRENTLFNILNVFLELFQEFETSWQWQLHFEKYHRNHCFLIVCQASTDHCLKMLMDLDWPYQNWGNTLFYIPDEFLKAFLKFQTNKLAVTSGTMENTIEINVFLLFGKFPLKMSMDFDWPYQKPRKTLYSIFQMTSWKHF